MSLKNIYILSDGTGETAEKVVLAAQTQFTNSFRIFKLKKIDSIVSVERAFNEIKGKAALIAYTIVDGELRKLVREKATQSGIQSIDILGPVLAAFEKVTGKRPEYQPGLTHELNVDYFRRMAALEFAVKYDDGKNPEGLKEADVVLIGVSRTSKTPLSIYLAERGVKVANVPIVEGIELPEGLKDIMKRKIIGLTISPARLLKLRQMRAAALKVTRTAYADHDRIVNEISYAERVIKKLGCTMIDISQKAIEETADEIIKIISREVS